MDSAVQPIVLLDNIDPLSWPRDLIRKYEGYLKGPSSTFDILKNSSYTSSYAFAIDSLLNDCSYEYQGISYMIDLNDGKILAISLDP